MHFNVSSAKLKENKKNLETSRISYSCCLLDSRTIELSDYRAVGLAIGSRTVQGKSCMPADRDYSCQFCLLAGGLHMVFTQLPVVCRGNKICEALSKLNLISWINDRWEIKFCDRKLKVDIGHCQII